MHCQLVGWSINWLVHLFVVDIDKIDSLMSVFCVKYRVRVSVGFRVRVRVGFRVRVRVGFRVRDNQVCS